MPALDPSLFRTFTSTSGERGGVLESLVENTHIEGLGLLLPWASSIQTMSIGVWPALGAGLSQSWDNAGKRLGSTASQDSRDAAAGGSGKGSSLQELCRAGPCGTLSGNGAGAGAEIDPALEPEPGTEPGLEPELKPGTELRMEPDWGWSQE